MDVYYEQTPSSALKRVAKRIGAIPQTDRSEGYNYVTTIATLAAGWNYTLLNGLVPGTGSSNRVGREIQMSNLDLTIGSTPGLRYMIVYDRQSNGNTPASTALTEDSTDQYSPWNFSNSERFDILFDSHFDRTPEQNIKYVHKSFPINLCTYYNSGVAGTVADITSGALYCAVWSSGVAGGNTFAAMLYFEE